MGRVSNYILIPFGAILLAAGSFPSEARAGYIAAGIGIRDEAASTFDSIGSSSTEETNSDRVLLTLEEWEHHVAGPGAGGMTSQTVTPSSSGATSCAVTQSELPAAAQLVSWLGPAGKVWVPPAFLSGIFRPPRFVG